MSHVVKHNARFTRSQSFWIVIFAYVAAIAVGWAALAYLPDWPTIWRVLAADVLATVVVWAVSFGYKNTSIYDPYWSVAPPLIVLWLTFLPELQAASLRFWLVNAVVWFWGIRLTANWVRSWAGLHTEDWRYLSFQSKTRSWYWLMSLLSFHLFPTLTVFAGMVPLFPALLDWPGGEGYYAFHWLDFVAFIIATIGVLFELIGDEQMHRFRQTPERDPTEPFAKGLWAWSRHPNYFGETTFWLGIGLFGVSANPGEYWWCLGGYVIMMGLFLGYSIPAMEKKSLEKRPKYKDVQRRVSVLLPWPPRG